jgi:lysophospholipase L1-like esterase
MNVIAKTCAVIVIAFSCVVCRADERPAPERWQEQMDAFAKQDATRPHSPAVVFVGSSSIRGWDLSKWFPDLPALNRGFGGSHIADSTHYLEVLVTKHQPQVVVFYAGDNDIAHGLTPDEVVSDYQEFVNALQRTLPETRLVYIAIKPSIQRWAMYSKMREVNQRIATIAAQDERQVFLDIASPMLATDDSQPHAKWFVADGLHLNDAGYELWSTLLKPQLKLERPTVPR